LIRFHVFFLKRAAFEPPFLLGDGSPSDRKYGQENRDIRREVFGDLASASTVIITGIFDEAWLLEIEAIAVE
jgi:hypothetical protein